jgi:hypothetical protein
VSVIATTRTGQVAQRDFPTPDAAAAAHIAIHVPSL